jgi:hypothetical protein
MDIDTALLILRTDTDNVDKRRGDDTCLFEYLCDPCMRRVSSKQTSRDKYPTTRPIYYGDTTIRTVPVVYAVLLLYHHHGIRLMTLFGATTGNRAMDTNHMISRCQPSMDGDSTLLFPK